MNRTNHKIALQSKECIMNALIELMKKQSYDSITITKICQKADLSRRTFYRLFESKEDVLNENLHLLTLKYIDSVPKDIALSFLDTARFYFEFMVQHKDFLLALKKCNLLYSIFSKYQASMPALCAHFKRTDNQICQSEHLSLINAFGFGGLNTMLIEWINHDFSETPDELLEALHLFLTSYN